MKKAFIKYMILILCCFFALTIGIVANKTYHKYIDYKRGTEYPEKNYTQSLATNDLVRLCDGYIRTNDLKYLDYIDELLNAEDYEQAVSEYYKNDVEFMSYTYLYGNKNTHLISAMYICAVNNDIDKFIAAMEKYYPQMSSGIRVICFNNTMLKIKTNFIKDNIDIIADTMHSLNFETGTHIHKILELSNVLIAYKVADGNNPKIKEIEKEIEAVYDEWKPTDKNAVEEIQKEQMENYIYCWTDMMKDHNSDSSPNTYSYADNGTELL